MNTDTHEVDLLRTLHSNIKECMKQYLEYAQLESINTFAKLSTTLILFIISAHLATALLIFLTFQTAYLLASIIGSLLLAIVGVIGIYILLGILLYSNRHRWIHRPILRILLRACNHFKEADTATPALEVFKRKEELKIKLTQTQEEVSSTIHKLVAPQPPTSFMDKLLRLLECGNGFVKGIKQGYNFVCRR